MLPTAFAGLPARRACLRLAAAARRRSGHAAAVLLLAAGGGCAPEAASDVPLSAMDAPKQAEAGVAVPAGMAVAAAPAAVPAVAVTGRGFAQVSGQPGGSLGERRLMAIRAARLEALRDLAEQVHGAGLTSQTVVRDSVVVDDEVRARLVVALRGARTVAILPKGEDGYEVVMQLDPAGLALVNRILRAGP